ncbi:glycosyltransferase family 1 protein [Leptolyngbya sp. CCNP1308]|uniref:glycosyltransferase family 4 protein n=1 Tax=Leptolyngbya sp. CCNP1308 TaxID=3110255 RepID=UPI002B20040D|nr:glycosyltransferase family 1 protein [Leptolyngbya sp. CCNP1308]MEA5447906.1 glycosyltransferase family 1 protein [Leptolyngbya sp. CCNP1308]
MKVAIPVSSAFPSAGGGYTFESEIVAALIDLAPAMRHQITIFSGAQGDGAVTPHPNLTILHPPSQLMTGAGPAALRWGMDLAYTSGSPKLANQADKVQAVFVRRFLQQNHFDFCWVLAPAALIQCPTRHIPYALTIWDLQHRLQPYFPEVSQGREWGKRDRFYRANLPRATYVVTGTERGKTEIDRFYQIAPERIQVIPFPTPRLGDAIANHASTKEEFLAQHGLPSQYFFYPAQFWPHKNHYTLLNAFKTLVDQHGADVALVLTGSDKGNAGYIKQLIQDLDLAARVHILGFVSKADLANLYKHALALVFPTHFGPDNLPPLEAFSLGCPVIASDVPGAAEQLGDAALLVDQRDVTQMAKEMKSLCENEALRHRLIQKGLTRAKSWQPQDYAKRLIALLDEFESIRYCWPNSTSHPGNT